MRPPGHHATANLADGYCYFNNVAIAAKHYLNLNPTKKVAIIDWDIHAGDGTYDIFKSDPNVLTISTHRHDNGTYWPFGLKGHYSNIGVNEGTGYHIMLGLNGINGDFEFSEMFRTFISPMVREFKPDLIITSCGFDSALGDPLGVTFELTPNGYAYLTSELMSMCEHVMVVLEGGYSLKNLSSCGLAIV